ncbi:hypothetical protein POTOM_010060 [Populus tomentosa]|uniref:Phosphoglycerate mutase-like protein 1 n=1 Tax=Populus tomentosa TaxID=118781 RepID=A0A8X8DC81_POPTO|nr:hypothetical protein POTOM_010060 [Populus tomentosa]
MSILYKTPLMPLPSPTLPLSLNNSLSFTTISFAISKPPRNLRPPLQRHPSSHSSSLPRCFSSLSEMDGTVGQCLYPLHRTKTIHLVRHAQGIHNVEGEKDYNAYMSEELFDAHLTPLGWRQVDNLRKHVYGFGINKKIELVIVSPLLRTMQTAVGVFGGEGYTDGINAPPLMVENAGKSNHPAISSLHSPPFIAVELCREHLIESDEDILWRADIREKDEEVAARGQKFLKWLWTRKEKEIAVVSHSGFLYHTLSAFGNDCYPSVKSEICTHFANCELRSVVLVDRGMIGSDTAITNYPGKNPQGLDLPSDVAEEINPS